MVPGCPGCPYFLDGETVSSWDSTKNRGSSYSVSDRVGVDDKGNLRSLCRLTLVSAVGSHGSTRNKNDFVHGILHDPGTMAPKLHRCGKDSDYTFVTTTGLEEGRPRAPSVVGRHLQTDCVHLCPGLDERGLPTTTECPVFTVVGPRGSLSASRGRTLGVRGPLGPRGSSDRLGRERVGSDPDEFCGSRRTLGTNPNQTSTSNKGKSR